MHPMKYKIVLYIYIYTYVYPQRKPHHSSWSYVHQPIAIKRGHHRALSSRLVHDSQVNFTVATPRAPPEVVIELEVSRWGDTGDTSGPKLGALVR